MVHDPGTSMIDPVKHAGQLASVFHLTCRLDSHDQANLDHAGTVIKCFSQCQFFPQRLEDHRVSRVNRQLTVLICIFCIFALVLHALSVILRLAASCKNKGTPGSTRLRGRSNTIIAAPVLTDDHPKLLGLTSVDAEETGVFKRGRKLSVEESTSVRPPSVVQATAQSTPNCDNVGVHSSLTTHEPHPGEIHETGAYFGDALREVPGSQRGASYPSHQSPAPIITRDYPGLLRLSYYRVTCFFGRFKSIVVAEYLCPSTGFNSDAQIPRNRAASRTRRFLRTLYGRRPTLFFLVIAVDDAVRDLWVLDYALATSKSESVWFTGLGGWVTVDDIELQVKKIHQESKQSTDSQVVILLTGHGDEHNRMILPMSKTIDASHLFELLSESHDAHMTVPATIVLDICRPDSKPGPEPPKGISSIWTSSPGEMAGAYRLRDGPYSCFITSMMMACRQQISRHIVKPPQELIQTQLDQLTAYLKERYSRKHLGAECRWCSSGKCCKPMSQNMDIRHAQSLDGLRLLFETLSRTKFAEGVHQTLMGDHVFCIANKLPAPKSIWDRLWGLLWWIEQVDGGDETGPLSTENTTAASGFDPIPKDNTRRHGRGANGHVHAA